MSAQNRRSFLRAATGAALAIPFLPSLHRTSHASPLAFPKRLVVFFSNLGTIAENFWPATPGPLSALSPILQPLDAYKSDLLVLGNISHLSGYPGSDPASGPGSGHGKGPAHALTAVKCLPGTYDPCGGGNPAGFASGPSIDQV